MTTLTNSTKITVENLVELLGNVYAYRATPNSAPVAADYNELLNLKYEQEPSGTTQLE